MNPSLRIKEIERITLRVPFKPRNQKWNKLLVWQWQIVEIIRVTTDDGTVGYGETLPHYTWGKVPEEAIERAKGRNPIELLGDDSLGAGLQMALYDVVGKALEVPV
ncbi:MAG: enolase, partial [Anaerolineae bacterium]|nr:enolase [Anaerolineae bacterium]